ncbi:hypothetical protein SELMODRAFT_412683 [Selaginella moellendorffii]|uniref:F-box domain-containing protein n=2 Tax=Selaginella moellendorffii TaxID=88036 RepID=D8RL51_SELML|nr:hypothetical protein SELMODRAFT_412683 [Selaginella moellendorffii]
MEEEASAAVWKDLPDALIERVLTLVPLPRLLQMRAVSKEWSLLILSQGFINLCARMDRSAGGGGGGDSSFFLFFTATGPGGAAVIAALSPVSGCWQPLSLDPIFGMEMEVSVVASGGGLLCLTAASRIIACNPLTRSWRLLPEIPGCSRLLPLLTAIQIDQKGGYKILVAGPGGWSDQRTFVFDSTTPSAWARKGDLPIDVLDLESEGVVSAGFLYVTCLIPRCRLLAFDFARGEWSKTQIPLPAGIASSNLVSCGEEVHLVAALGEAIRIWKLGKEAPSWDLVEEMPRELCCCFLDGGAGRDSFRCAGRGSWIFVLSYDGVLGSWAMAEDCSACGRAGTVTTDPLSGLFCCCECGVVVDDDALGSDHQVGLVGERGGTLVAGEGIGALPGKRFLYRNGGSDQYFAKKKQDALRRIRDVAAALRLQPNDADEVEAMVDRATNGDWGSGRWFDALVGACAYVVVRNHRLPLTLVEVAYASDCGVRELGRVLGKLVREFAMALPQEDPIVFLERLVLTHAGFSKLSRDAARKIIGQCRVLLEWMATWFVSTGRHALPAAAAALVIVADANRIEIGLEEVSSELHSPVATSMKRFREIQEALVSTMKTFPWCKTVVTTKNISCHLCFMLRYLETSLKLGKTRRREDSSAIDRVQDEDQSHSKNKKLRHLPEESPVLPVSFIASRSSRCARVVKAELATQRIASAKRSLARGMPVDKDRPEGGLDCEDMTIESLLLRGVTRDQIEQGYYESLIADLAPGGDDQPISDDELAKYFYTKDEASRLAQQIKLQNILSAEREKLRPL